MRLPYGTGAYSRTRGNLPSLDVVNMFVEKSPTDQSGVIMQSRKGLVEDSEVGDGPIRGTLRKDGVFDGDTFAVSGNELYRGATLLGEIEGDGVVVFAASDLEVVVAAGGPLYSYNGDDLIAVNFPDYLGVASIAYQGSRFTAIPLSPLIGAGGFYFSDIADGRAWDGDDFANAESAPDSLRDILVMDGVLILLGSETIEFWAETGDPLLPYTPIKQRIFERGVIATGCAVVEDNTFFWIGPDKITYRNGDVPQAVADDGIVERSVASTSWRLFLVEDERHKFLCQQHDADTMVLDITTNEWAEWKSHGRSNFRAGPGLGDDETGIIWRMEGYVDAGGPFERRFRAGAALEAPVAINNLRLTCEVGTTDYLTGDYVAPVIEMRDSRDAGNTWSDYEPVTVGEQGQYRERVEWRALGMFDDPGMLFEFRMTDPVSFRLSNVDANASSGGRSR